MHILMKLIKNSKYDVVVVHFDLDLPQKWMEMKAFGEEALGMRKR